MVDKAGLKVENMAVIEMNWRPSCRDLRMFAVVQLIVSAIIAWLLHRRLGWDTAAVGLMGLAIVGLIVGLWSPQWIRPLYLAWIVAGFPIGWVNAHVLLAVIYYCVFTPIGFLLKLSGRDPLQLKPRADATSYWCVRPEPPESTRYFRQF